MVVVCILICLEERDDDYNDDIYHVCDGRERESEPKTERERRYDFLFEMFVHLGVFFFRKKILAPM
jgi:hypothetical protein